LTWESSLQAMQTRIEIEKGRVCFLDAHQQHKIVYNREHVRINKTSAFPKYGELNINTIKIN